MHKVQALRVGRAQQQGLRRAAKGGGGRGRLRLCDDLNSKERLLRWGLARRVLGMGLE